MSFYTFSSLLPMSFCINKCISKTIFPWCMISILRFHQVLLCDRFWNQTRQKSWLLIPISVSSSRPVLLGYPCKPLLFFFLVAHAQWLNDGSALHMRTDASHNTPCNGYTREQPGIQGKYMLPWASAHRPRAQVSARACSSPTASCQQKQTDKGVENSGASCATVTWSADDMTWPSDSPDAHHGDTDLGAGRGDPCPEEYFRVWQEAILMDITGRGGCDEEGQFRKEEALLAAWSHCLVSCLSYFSLTLLKRTPHF